MKTIYVIRMQKSLTGRTRELMNSERQTPSHSCYRGQRAAALVVKGNLLFKNEVYTRSIHLIQLVPGGMPCRQLQL